MRDIGNRRDGAGDVDETWPNPQGEPGGLAEALEALRAELDAAQAAGAGRSLRFEIEEATLELQLELRSDLRPGVKLAFGVVTADVGGERGHTRTHTLTLTLKVRDEPLGGRYAVVWEDRTEPWNDGADGRPDRSRPAG
ncbi:trypco2 family protein [Streptomyces sp. NPDC102364]|uniref:trypco2 family protein n=1 Tax=Streptomyces sp. NPDC102364 TaxID=3366161 RepID=UPI003800656B